MALIFFHLILSCIKLCVLYVINDAFTFGQGNILRKLKTLLALKCLEAISRSSHSRCSMKKDVLENFPKFTGKHLYQSLFCQLIKYNVRNIFLQKLCKKWGREARSRPLFVFKKDSIKGKASGQHLSLIYFGRPRLGHKLKTNWLTIRLLI